jgi:hypothetical protein
MRATLEQLKAMNDVELKWHWFESKFPFDRMKHCNACLTLHGIPHECGYHDDVIAEVMALRIGDLDWETERAQKLRENLEALYALRLFYDSFYTQLAEATPSPSAALAANDARTEVVEK